MPWKDFCFPSALGTLMLEASHSPEISLGTFKHYYVRTPHHTYSLDLYADSSGFSGRYKKMGSREVVDVGLGEEFEPGTAEPAAERTLHHLLCRCISEIEKSDGPVTALIDVPQRGQDRKLHELGTP